MTRAVAGDAAPGALSGLLLVLSVAFGLLPVQVAEAQQREPPRVGVLHPGFPPPAPQSPIVEGLREGLRDVGYVEGRTIRLEYRWARGNPDALPKLAAELMELKVAVVIAVSMPALRAARDVAGTTPIVITDLQIDPVASGLVHTFARPRGNITGLFLDLPDLTGKWLQLVRQVAPSARRIAVLWDSTTGTDQLRAIQSAALAAGIELQVVEVRAAADYDRALALALQGQPEALVQLSSPVIQQSGSRVAAFALKNRLPAISMFSSFADAGGLIAYGPDLPVFFRRSATYVDRILKGATPADLPVERPDTYQLIINSQTAKTLGLTLPTSLLLRADRVIQ